MGAVVSAQIFAFRPFESARDQARRAGCDPKQAIAEVRAEQERGGIGNHVAGKYRAIAHRSERGPDPLPPVPPKPRGAA